MRRQSFQPLRDAAPSYYAERNFSPVASRAPLGNPIPIFAIILEFRGGFNRINVSNKEIDVLISACPTKPEKSVVIPNRSFPIGKLFFRDWGKALDAYVYFWDRCLSGHPYSPAPLYFSSVHLQRYEEEREERLRELFVDHAQRLLCGDTVKKVEKKITDVTAEVQKITGLLADKNSVPVFLDLHVRKDAFLVESKQLVNRLEEFRVAINDLITWIKGPQHGHCIYGAFEVYEFGDVVDWQRVWMLMARECRRLDDGLPIYSCRRKILSQVLSNQVTVLIGETGSGKSTQFVQFLADSGLSANGSIVCTQPRKIAAVSLAHRVREESHGCYIDNSVVSYATYSSSQRFDSTIIFMTDYCLLQHCMSNTTFSGISCIIVDEVHERSLNTDLLLALIKKQLLQRCDLRLVIMSATADAEKISEYFFGCQTVHVTGRNFPVEINYIPDVSLEASWINITKHIGGNLGSYVSDVVKMVSVIHKTEDEGAILAFLTAQAEVEWACENFQSPSAVVFPLHGKLSCEDQARIFQSYIGKRKIIFSTNLSETSLTIPGVKFVVDSGMVKESRFESGSGMNVLRVCRVSQSSAQQRAGRAGRTEPGKCYRLYSECDFQSMLPYQEPEIQKVHLGIAVLRIIALGIKNVKEFEFIDTPSFKAVDTAIQNLIRLGAVFCRDDGLELTDAGKKMVKLGIEPRLGKIILECIGHGLVREGIVLSALMTNASSIFCRIGSVEDKQKADCYKIPFCHQDGDLFTLLSVYKEWEHTEKNKNQWCWQNSINAKSLRRCRDTIHDIESCLRHELNTITPSYWKWNPQESTFTEQLKKAILSSLAENVAIYSGCEQLGYEVAQTCEHIQLHPSCSLHIYDQKPNLVVFSDIISTSNQYLVCVTAVAHEYLHRIQPPPLYDISKLEKRMLKKTVLEGIGSRVLRRFCGKGNQNLLKINRRIKDLSKNPRSNVIVDFEKGAIYILALLEDTELASSVINNALNFERKLLHNECTEKYLFHGGSNVSPSFALWGSGAEVKHLELGNRSPTVEISHSNASTIDDKELLMLIDSAVPHISGFCKHTHTGQVGVTSNVWGTVTFIGSEYSEEAIRKLDGVEFCGSTLGVRSAIKFKSGNMVSSFHAVRVKLCWPRKYSKGVAFIKCALQDIEFVVQDFYSLIIGGRHVHCDISLKHRDCVIITGIDKDISEREIFDIIRRSTKRTIIDFWLLRGDTVYNLSTHECEEALRREIAPFMSCGQHTSGKCRIEVFNPEPKDFTMKAIITFDGSLHLEAAKALDHLQGRVLPGCESWQKIDCQHLFRSSISCPRCIYFVIKYDLELVLKNFKRIRGGSYEFDRCENGAVRIKLLADATKTIADMRKPLDLLIKGKLVNNSALTPLMMDFLFSRDGVALMKSVECETGTCVIFDKHKLTLKVFGSCKNVDIAEKRLVLSLVSIHENKQLEIHFRSNQFPRNLMNEVVRKFGPDLRGLKEKVPGAEFVLNTRHQRLSLKGNKEMKQRVDEIISAVAKSLEMGRVEVVELSSETACPICLCEPEEPYTLEACRHVFCYSCLVEQCESAIRTRDGFPLCCAKEGCKAPILIVDLRFLLLNNDRLEELFRASLNYFVTSSAGVYRFCPSPDCPSVYKVAGPNGTNEPFLCDACLMETCTKCHNEYHPFLSCELYKEYKEQPDLSLTDWMKGKENVKKCPVCDFTIEKIDGCNHISCRCGKHICWVCLEAFENSDDCYNHLRNIHLSIS